MPWKNLGETAVKTSADITTLLDRLQHGDAQAESQLVNRIYDEVLVVASRELAGERVDHTWQTADLAHEALRKLIDQQTLQQAPNRRFLFFAAAKAARQLLVDHARRHGAQKRGAGHRRVVLDDVDPYGGDERIDYVDLDEALNELRSIDHRRYEVVHLRFFLRRTNEQVAQDLGISLSTVESDWRAARAWLQLRLQGPHA